MNLKNRKLKDNQTSPWVKSIILKERAGIRLNQREKDRLKTEMFGKPSTNNFKQKECLNSIKVKDPFTGLIYENKVDDTYEQLISLSSINDEVLDIDEYIDDLEKEGELNNVLSDLGFTKNSELKNEGVLRVGNLRFTTTMTPNKTLVYSPSNTSVLDKIKSLKLDKDGVIKKIISTLTKKHKNLKFLPDYQYDGWGYGIKIDYNSIL